MITTRTHTDIEKIKRDLRALSATLKGLVDEASAMSSQLYELEHSLSDVRDQVDTIMDTIDGDDDDNE